MIPDGRQKYLAIDKQRSHIGVPAMGVLKLI